MANVRIKYTGKALPDNGDVVELFSTVTAAWPANGFACFGFARIIFSINNSQAGTLKVYQSSDRGVTWVQIVADQSVAAAAASTENINDYLVENYADWKVTWTNGATIQTVFTVNIAASTSRNVGN